MARGTLSSAEVRELAAVLYRDRHRDLLAIAAHHGPRAVDPADTVQAAFAAFVERFDLPAALAYPWLVTTLTRLAWRAGRTLSRRREIPTPAPPTEKDGESFFERLPARTPDALERVLELELAEERLVALQGLAPTARRVVILVALGYSHPEIAELTGFTPRQIRRYAHRAHRELGVS